jgi:gamma-glutamylcyclotransferase (GGCT)/AIG2-like uncharacterized protein YtfP
MDTMTENADAGLQRLLSAPPTHRLFVYGTLMSKAASAYGVAARTRLIQEAWPYRWPASSQGQLYELGRYPGLIASSAPDDVVHGELLLLSDPAATLPWLDDYEAISSDPAADNEYVREIRDVILDGGVRTRAWSYLYVRPATGLRRIVSGRWAA